jgi:hypothetical protein
MFLFSGSNIINLNLTAEEMHAKFADKEDGIVYLKFTSQDATG